MQEPFCLPLATVKRLTAWQVKRLYLLPAAERLRREAGGGEASAAPKGHDWTKGLPPRADFIAERMRAQAEGGEQGKAKTAAEWGEIWDQMDAKLKAHAASANVHTG